MVAVLMLFFGALSVVSFIELINVGMEPVLVRWKAALALTGWVLSLFALSALIFVAYC